MTRISYAPARAKRAEQFDRLFDGTDLLIVDFDGVVGPTELVQQIAFQQLLEEKTGRSHDLLEVQQDATGRTMMDIMEGYIEAHGLDESPEALLERQCALYLEIIKDNGIGPNEGVVALLNAAKARGVRAVILSNGNDDAVDVLLGKWGLGDLFDGIYASRNEDRRLFAEARGIKVGDKAHLIEAFLGEKGIDFSRAAIVEDNEKTLDKIQGVVKGIQTIFVRQEFNKDAGYEPTTGVTIDGFAGGLFALYRQSRMAAFFARRDASLALAGPR
ncbi:MAG: HAD hydrolase-like protein [Alphaproteobacteria bacterium]|nr:HAD hydrolase-like protein [Alphaproteobacteria bacterium]